MFGIIFLVGCFLAMAIGFGWLMAKPPKLSPPDPVPTEPVKIYPVFKWVYLVWGIVTLMALYIRFFARDAIDRLQLSPLATTIFDWSWLILLIVAGRFMQKYVYGRMMTPEEQQGLEKLDTRLIQKSIAPMTGLTTILWPVYIGILAFFVALAVFAIYELMKIK